ncbi:MAG: hypothetical protein IKQ22_08050 [Clostridia bacterium]|nr:hypothetical protein [Clostridia bacterium]
MNFITRRHKIYRDLIDHITSRILEMEDGEKSSFHKLVYEFFSEKGFDPMMIEVTYEARDLYGDGWYSGKTGDILVLPNVLLSGIRKKVLENINWRKVIEYRLEDDEEEDEERLWGEFIVGDLKELTYIEPGNYFSPQARKVFEEYKKNKKKE